MQEKLVEKLGLKYQPVGIWFTDTEPENVIYPSAEKRSCVVDLMRGVLNGRDIATTDTDKKNNGLKTCVCRQNCLILPTANQTDHYLLCYSANEYAPCARSVGCCNGG